MNNLVTIPITEYVVEDMDRGKTFETRDFDAACAQLEKWRAVDRDHYNAGVRLIAVIDA